MKPYGSWHGVDLYLGDNREILPQLVDVADLLVTDPPYGKNYQSNQRGAAKFSRIRHDTEETRAIVEAGLAAAFRALRECRHAYVFGPFDLTAVGFGSVVELVWDKGQTAGGDMQARWGSEHERLSFGVRAAAKTRRTGYGSLSARLRRGSVLHFARLHGMALKHPQQKPVLLLRELIESSSCIGETVLDPFAGAGSTLVAALREGRRAVGVEIDERWCEIAATRLQREAAFQAGD